MFCPKCGTKTNSENQPTCSHCGFDLAGYARQSKPGNEARASTQTAVPASNPFQFAPSILPPAQTATTVFAALTPPAPPALPDHPLEDPLLPSSPPPVVSPEGIHKKILLVEDDAMIAELYERTLNQGGYALTIARDGREGRELLTVGGYSLVLLDLMLPGENGLNLLKIMKVEHRLPDVPVIILSNLDSSAVIDRGLELGAVNFLIKANNSPNDVLALVKKTIG